MGFRHVGENCLLSDKASYYNCKNISIGSNTRIDDFSVLSAGDGGIEIGEYVHLAIGTSLIGAGKIFVQDFAGLSSRVSVYSSNDDYSGQFLTNPTVPSRYTNVMSSDVIIGKHVIVGSGSVILPGVTLEIAVYMQGQTSNHQNNELFHVLWLELNLNLKQQTMLAA
jgi:dTDP-4-amino-4,6-dideoxy-D-glucose acyltransferase